MIKDENGWHYDEEGDVTYVPFKDYLKAQSQSFWLGCIVATIGSCLLGFVSLWIAGAFVP